MLGSMKDLEGYAIRATDGDIGHVKDLYFDDDKWVIRYFVVETGTWLSSRKVLISPFAVGDPDWTARVLPISITKEQVKNSPDIDTDKPVSRQHEMQYLGYYGYPYYWGGAGLWGAGVYPGMMLTNFADSGRYAEDGQAQADYGRAEDATGGREDGDPHLRSCKAAMKYHIQATDGNIGHVQGLLVDMETWAVRYMVVNTSSWWLGHQVLIATQWIWEVRWSDETVVVKLSQQAVKSAPSYDAAVSLSRDQEMSLHQHHGRAGYWAGEVKLENSHRVAESASQEATHKPRDGATHDTRHGL